MTTPSQHRALVNNLIRRITSLVHDRDELRTKHASIDELETVSVEISRLQWRLARIIQNQLVQSQRSHLPAA